MIAVQPHPIFLIPANFQVAVADITVAICNDERLLVNTGKGIESFSNSRLESKCS